MYHLLMAFVGTMHLPAANDHLPHFALFATGGLQLVFLKQMFILL